LYDHSCKHGNRAKLTIYIEAIKSDRS